MSTHSYNHVGLLLEALSPLDFLGLICGLFNQVRNIDIWLVLTCSDLVVSR